ncbi:GntR family transcriptional regulator [Vallitalea maricola]|uniref:GntR family transcriptional regulator n=1 Tax=Vallitalea maricola TaxID=3074433 RepID=A0ACB5UMH1_9FIRM|nr:GntR family transcriptional regulator [Vallitalea sp. AN17-2]
MASKKEEIIKQLKEEILCMELKPGTIISETTLSERFQISRTPIRDILKQLSAEGYIDIYPQKGSIVSYIDLESVEQIIYLRSTLEKEIIKELSLNIPLKGLHELKTILTKQEECIKNHDSFNDFMYLDDAFHKNLFTLAGRLFLWDIIQQFNAHYIRYRKLNMLKEEKLTEILEEHQLILKYIIDGKTDKIEQLVHHHIRADVNSFYFQENFDEYIKK